MKALSHLGWIAFGLAAPTALTFWSITDSGPRSRAHYERVAAQRTDTQAVLERIAKAEFSPKAQIIAQGDRGLILDTAADGTATTDLFTVVDGKVTDRKTLVPQAQLATDEPTAN